MGPVTWEYTYVSAGTGVHQELVERLNDLGAVGWELVNFATVDRTLGANTLMAIMKRPARGLPGPDDPAPRWMTDPAGRFARRYWDGLRWTEHVADEAGGQSTDSPVLV